MKTLFKEFLWITGCIFSAWIITVILFSANISGTSMFSMINGDSTMDLHFHDTYFIIKTSFVFVHVFSFVLFICYSIREAFYKYRRTIQNSILVFFSLFFFLIQSSINEFALVYYSALTAAQSPRKYYDYTEPFSVGLFADPILFLNLHGFFLVVSLLMALYTLYLVARSIINKKRMLPDNSL